MQLTHAPQENLSDMSDSLSLSYNGNQEERDPRRPNTNQGRPEAQRTSPACLQYGSHIFKSGEVEWRRLQHDPASLIHGDLYARQVEGSHAPAWHLLPVVALVNAHPAL